MGSFGGNLQKLPPNFSEVAFICGNHQTKRILGQLLRSLLQNPRNFSEVAPEVRPAVHTAPLRLVFGGSFRFFFCLGAGEGEEVCEQVAGAGRLVLKIEGGGSRPSKGWGGSVGEGGGVYGQNGVDFHFPVLCLLALGDIALKS